MTSCVSSSELERGDVLLVTAQPRNAYAALILELDDAPGGFSHCGVALDDRHILSARIDLRDVWLGSLRLDLDLGGLSADPFSYFWEHGQRIHRMDVDPAERAAAARRLKTYDELPGGFSLPKIVGIAATLHALNPLNGRVSDEGRAVIVHRAAALATAWRRDGDFFCAEFVATLYGWTFRVGDLRPPGARFDAVVPQVARSAVRAMAFALTRLVSDRRRRTVYALLEAVRTYDPDFLSGDRDRADEHLHRLAGDLGTPPRRSARARVPALDDATIVPPGLVTPRMIASRHLGTDAPVLVGEDRRSR